jgi:hypothetical protein
VATKTPKPVDLDRVLARFPRVSERSARGVPIDVGAGATSQPPPLPPGLSPDQSEVVRALQLYLPEIFPIPGSTEFEFDAIAASPGVGTIIPAALQQRIPQNSIGIIRVFGQGIDDMTQATRVTWRLIVNNHAAPGWGAFTLFPGVAARVTSSSDVFVRLPDGAQIEVRIQNADGAAYLTGANYSGWYWPISTDLAWRGQLYKRARISPSTKVFG